jgi:hypothetical protein
LRRDKPSSCPSVQAKSNYETLAAPRLNVMEVLAYLPAQAVAKILY